MGSLAEKNLAGIRADVSMTLQMHHGIPGHEADKIVEFGVPEAANGQTHPVCDLRELLLELRSMGIKSALCTADSRYVGRLNWPVTGHWSRSETATRGIGKMDGEATTTIPELLRYSR